MIYALGRIIFWIYLHIFNRFIVFGRENIPAGGALITFGNHFSDLDIFVVQQLYPGHVYFMAKKELFDTPFVRFFVKAYGAISVDRKANDIGAIKAAFKVLKKGEILGIFPEGTRVRDGSRPDAKGGLAMFAYKTSTPLQPIRIKYKRKLNLFNRIEVIIDKPIMPSELMITSGTGEEYDKVTNELMDKVYSL